MKRAGKLKEKLLSDENLELAIDEVNATHRWGSILARANREVSRDAGQPFIR